MAACGSGRASGITIEISNYAMSSHDAKVLTINFRILISNFDAVRSITVAWDDYSISFPFMRVSLNGDPVQLRRMAILRPSVHALAAIS